MVRIASDMANTAPGVWECPRCGRSNRERDHTCPNCRLPHRAGPRERVERSVETDARPVFRRVTPAALEDRAARASRLERVLGSAGSARDAAALTTFAALLTQYEQWQAVTQGPEHRFQVGAAYLALVPGDLLLLEAFRFEAATLVLERLRVHGLAEAASEWEAALADLTQETGLQGGE